MLTILLVITSFWAVVIWFLFEKSSKTNSSDSRNETRTKKSNENSFTIKSIGKSERLSSRRNSTNVLRNDIQKASVDSGSVSPAVLKEEKNRAEGVRTPSPEAIFQNTYGKVNGSVSGCACVSSTGDSSCLGNINLKNSSADSHIPPRLERRSVSYSVPVGQASEHLNVVNEERGRRLSRNCKGKGRSVSPRRRRSSDACVTLGSNCPVSSSSSKREVEKDYPSRGRPVKRETKREKLLRKRRRIISQLQEKDIDELLRVYFFCDTPKEDFEFATPLNIDAKVRLPTIRTTKARPSATTDDRSLSNNGRGSKSGADRDAVDGVPHPERPSGSTSHGPTSSLSRHSSPIEDLEQTYQHYTTLKLLGQIDFSWRDVDSHIPSFFDQPRKRAWSLVIYDRGKNSSTTAKRKGQSTSKSLEGRIGAQPSIFGTVADDKSPRDNTRRGFPQTSKGAKGGFDVDGTHPLPEWALAEDDDNSLVYEEGVLVSGCIGALVLHATPTPTYYPDAAYLFAFLLSARLFIKPHELLQKICSLGFAQQGLVNDDVNTINKDELGNFVPHMVQLLGEWSETFPYDFRDERMMVGVRTMTHRCIALQPSLRRDVTQVLHNLLNKLTQLERHEETLSKLTVPPPADYLPTVPDITEACPSALVLAQQLTHIELERLSYIGPEEFVQAFAKDNLESTYKDLKKTNNLESYVQWFNRLSYLVATQACSPVKKKQRIRVIETWIEVARECFNIGNFNSLMGIIAGLNMSPVARLKKTWSKVQTAKFSVLEHQMDPSSNFSSYRSTLKAAMWRSAGAVDERQKIVIPFFSLLVKDLYFLNEGCANRLPNGHINFDKFWQLAKQVTEFMAWKQVSCPFEKDAQVLHYLQTTPVLSETGLAIASFEGEGPDNSYEKERFKNLKSETHPQPN